MEADVAETGEFMLKSLLVLILNVHLPSAQRKQWLPKIFTMPKKIKTQFQPVLLLNVKLKQLQLQKMFISQNLIQLVTQMNAKLKVRLQKNFGIRIIMDRN